MINPITGKKYLFNATSVDDMRSSIKNRTDIEELKIALDDELHRQRRTAAIALLKARIKKLEKLKQK